MGLSARACAQPTIPYRTAVKRPLCRSIVLPAAKGPDGFRSAFTLGAGPDGPKIGPESPTRSGDRKHCEQRRTGTGPGYKHIRRPSHSRHDDFFNLSQAGQPLRLPRHGAVAGAAILLENSRGYFALLTPRGRVHTYVSSEQVHLGQNRRP